MGLHGHINLYPETRIFIDDLLGPAVCIASGDGVYIPDLRITASDPDQLDALASAATVLAQSLRDKSWTDENYDEGIAV